MSLRLWYKVADDDVLVSVVPEEEDCTEYRRIGFESVRKQKEVGGKSRGSE